MARSPRPFVGTRTWFPGIGAMATHYVSNTATNGYSVGTNSGAGSSKAAPWLTLDYAIANAPAGSVIEVNDGTYQAATFYNVNKSITIQGRRPNSGILQAADGQTRIINVLPVADTTVTLVNLLLDGRGNTTRAISMSNGVGVVSGIVVRNCSATGVTQGHFESGQLDMASIRIDGLTCEGTISQRPFYVQAKSGSVSINGLTLSGVTTTGSSCAAVEVLRITGGASALSVAVRGVRGTLTGPAAATTHGINLLNIDDALIENNSLTIQGGNNGALYWVSCNNASLTAHRPIIRNNEGANLHGGGYCMLVGTDGSSVGNNRHNSPVVSGNTVTANASAASPIHGVMFGWGSGGVASGNRITGAGHALLAKDWTGGEFSRNEASNFNFDGIYAKGSTGTMFSNNTLNVNIALSQAAIRVAWDDVSAAYSSGVQITGNVVNYTAAGQVITNVEPGNTATFTSNTYNIGAALPASAWNYQGVGYATLAAWKAAIEPTAQP